MEQKKETGSERKEQYKLFKRYIYKIHALKKSQARILRKETKKRQQEWRLVAARSQHRKRKIDELQ